MIGGDNKFLHEALIFDRWVRSGQYLRIPLKSCDDVNHVHLLIERQANAVGRIMHRLLTGYAQYYNSGRSRGGASASPLFFVSLPTDVFFVDGAHFRAYILGVRKGLCSALVH